MNWGAHIPGTPTQQPKNGPGGGSREPHSKISPSEGYTLYDSIRVAFQNDNFRNGRKISSCQRFEKGVEGGREEIKMGGSHVAMKGQHER